MKTLRTTSVVAALAATLTLGTILSAQEPDTTRAGGAGDEPMPMMEPGQMHGDMEMSGMMPMMRMMRMCMQMMGSMGETESMDMGGMMDMMGTMGSMDSMPEDPEEALRHSDDLGLSEVQVERLEEARDRWRASRNAAMERMREARVEMRQATEVAQERTRDVLTPDQLDRLRESARRSMSDCPMHSGSGGDHGEESDAESGETLIDEVQR